MICTNMYDNILSSCALTFILEISLTARICPDVYGLIYALDFTCWTLYVSQLASYEITLVRPYVRH